MADLLLLGPTDLRDGSRSLPLGAPRQRAVLAMLALARGRVVPTAALVDGVWGEDPPTTVLNAIQVYVAGARKCLSGAGLEGALVTQAPGYRLFLPAGALDVDGLERAVEDGDRAGTEGRRPAAAAAYQRGVQFWRGEPLADLDGCPFVEGERARLHELRLRALTGWAEQELALGRPDAVLPALESQTREHAFHEPLWVLLARAHYAAGRQQDALAAVRRVRRLLRDELGADPGPALREVEAQVLVQDPGLPQRRVVDFGSASTHLVGGSSTAHEPEHSVGALVLPDGRAVPIRAGDTVVGRHETCDVVVTHRDVSRRHLLILADATGVWAQDLGSTNGTTVNGAAAPTTPPGLRLRPGDRLELGRVVVRFDTAGE